MEWLAVQVVEGWINPTPWWVYVVPAVIVLVVTLYVYEAIFGW